VLVVLDGAKALRAAVDAVFGDVSVQRCIRHYADLCVMPTRVRSSCSRRVRVRFCRHNHSASRNARMRSLGW
jgi:transposase-like protein